VGTDFNQCVGTKTININVIAGPNITAVPIKPTICAGQTTSLTVNAGGAYTLTSPSGSAIINNPLAAVSPTSTTTYTVTNQNAAGCKGNAMVTITVSTCTGIDAIAQNSRSAIGVYPNPSNGEFTITSDVDITINITNDLGQFIKTLSLEAGNDHQVSLSGFANGIYFISGRADDKVVSQKIVIAH
jgi:hypothetical protein